MTKAEYELFLELAGEIHEISRMVPVTGTEESAMKWFRVGTLIGELFKVHAKKKKAEQVRRNESRKSSGKRKDRADAKAKSRTK